MRVSHHCGLRCAPFRLSCHYYSYRHGTASDGRYPVRRLATATAAATTTRQRSVFRNHDDSKIFRSCSTIQPSSLSSRPSQRLPIFQSRRTIVTWVQEPPLDSTVPERPVTVALVQDPIFDPNHNDDNNTWTQKGRTILPRRFGMSFAHFQLFDFLPKADSEQEEWWMEEALEALHTDITSLGINPAHVVLVAQGPLVSWVAQFYLESHSLAGLILVDPLVPLFNFKSNDDHNDDGDDDDKDALLKDFITMTNMMIQATTTTTANAQTNPLYLKLLQSTFFIQKNHNNNQRQLLLEPGAVPMMILLSLSQYPIFVQGVLQTANRHRGENHDNATAGNNMDQQDHDQNTMIQPYNNNSARAAASQKHHGHELDLTKHVPLVNIAATTTANASTATDDDNDNAHLEGVFQDIIGPWIEEQVL